MKASDFPIEGEVWRSRPDGLISVSDQGRAKTMGGNLIAHYWVRGQVRWSYGVRGTSYQVKASSLVAELFLGGCPSEDVEHRNGDLRDIRACNLIIPWSEYQDAVIMEADTCTSAAERLGLTFSRVARRAKTLGKTWWRKGFTHGVPLADRLEEAKRVIALLEAAGISDRDINLALSIPKMPKRDKRADATDRCLAVLYDQMSAAEIAAALGWKHHYSITKRLRDLGLVKATGWAGRTRAGFPDDIDGEEWREHPDGVWVSNMGRVATGSGLLSVQRRPNCTPFIGLQVRGQARSVAVARLMLDVFRPGLPYSKKLFINGDFCDVRLANIGVPVDRAQVREVKRLVPSNWEPQDRNEVEQFALLALMDGRAQTPAEAIKYAKRQQRDLKGLHKTWSLDEADGDHRAGIDRLSSDGTFIDNGRV